MNNDHLILEPYRRYLEVLARVHLDDRLRGKLDPEDIAQQALLRAHAAFEELRGREPPVIIAWLRRILARTLSDSIKHFERDKRDVDREQLFADALERSSSGLAGWLAADQTSPSAAAVRNEEMFRLAGALATLAEPMREVVIRKHLQNQTLKQIADALGKSLPSIAGYLRRGLEELRLKMGD